ncbi:hypothetical protein LUW75_03225 [Streptomyces sp. MRC013]|nr:hypothetical protein [Streptomyces sp. MRC013]URM89184.1 hypothetical protein LUW75_03225 [Streptomyces sp. MRC013]
MSRPGPRARRRVRHGPDARRRAAYPVAGGAAGTTTNHLSDVSSASQPPRSASATPGPSSSRAPRASGSPGPRTTVARDVRSASDACCAISGSRSA